jgi:hypothetical protein
VEGGPVFEFGIDEGYVDGDWEYVVSHLFMTFNTR